MYHTYKIIPQNIWLGPVFNTSVGLEINVQPTYISACAEMQKL